METYGPPLTIDMSGVRLMDSSGLKALVDIRAHARRAGHLPQIRLRGLAGQVARVLEITGVATLFVRL